MSKVVSNAQYLVIEVI